MTHRKRLAGALMVLALLGTTAACGGDDGGGADAEPQTRAGCDTLTETSTEEMFVLKLFDCTTAGAKTRVYTFNDNEARDNWRKVGEQMGAVVLNSGDRWLQVKP